MKKSSKYIILIITLFAILYCKGEMVSPKDNIPELIKQLAAETESLSTDFPDSCNAQLINFTNSQSLNKSTLRRDNSQRHLSYLLKVNKTAFEKVSYCIINKSTLKQSLSSEPTHRLISLGKLII
ncbi:MAG: hypothetical protein IJZ06_04940 [Bacteroidales bacterium]|nr:hypothetical protein [Bacteroidales bacterium]